ncbi:hypothetical protein WP50_10320, partial [Lactiplantibacillus plantarum]
VGFVKVRRQLYSDILKRVRKVVDERKRKKHIREWDSAAGQINYALNEPGESSLLKSVLRMTNPTEAAYKFFATWESGGAMNGTGGLRESQASAVYRYIKGFENGGFGNKA